MTSRPLNSRKQLFLLIAVLLPALWAVAIDITKSADDYFHNGAMSYLSNNIPAALNVVTNGLEQYPNDEKLKKLEALLKQQQQQQQDQQNQQQNQDQQKDQQQSDSKDQKDKDQQSKQDQQQQQSQQQDQQKNDQESQQKAGQSGDKEKQDAQGQAANASDRQQEMTPEQALRVLDSTKGDEKVLPLQQQVPPPSGQKIKDW